jgi:aminobenzoyl-glutamate utilization protein B
MFLRKSFVITFVALFLVGTARTAEKATPSKEKEFVFKVVERNSKAIALLGDNIYYFAELGMQEFETAKLMSQSLRTRASKSSAVSQGCRLRLWQPTGQANR